MARPRKYVVRLTVEEVERIRKKAKRKNTPATIKDRCNILLDMDENLSPYTVLFRNAAALAELSVADQRSGEKKCLTAP